MAGRNQTKLGWRLPAAVYAASLLYVLFQGGKTALMLFMILNLLLVYLLIGRWSGISGVKGSRQLKNASGVTGPVLAFSAGQPLEVALSVKIPGFYPIPYVIIRDTLVRHNGQRYEFDSSVVLSLKRTGDMKYQMPALPRGEYRFDRTLCAASDVFGLFEHQGTFMAEASFSIMPATVPLRRWQGLQLGVRGLFSHTIAPRSSKETTQINGVREYLYGDRLSRIHWNATARTGEWKSKEFERESLPRTVIVLDCCKGDYSADTEETFELAVSVAASLMESGLRSDTVMGLMSAGDKTVMIQPKPGQDQRSAALKHLTKVQLDGSRTLFAALKSSEGLLDAGIMVVLITADSAKNTLPCMEWLQKRGMSPCFIHIDPRKGAGEAAERQLYQQMRGGGWPVISVSRLQDLPSLLEGGGAA